MAAYLEWEASRLSSPCDHPLVTCHAQGCQTLGNEHIAALLPLALQTTQGPEFASANRVNAGRSTFGAAHMQLSGLEVDGEGSEAVLQ